MKCAAHHPSETAPEATGLVRYVASNHEIVSGPLCDPCQVSECVILRPAERRGEIKELGAVPLDFRERKATAKVRPGRVTDAMVEAYAETTAGMAPHRPATIRDGLVAALKQREIERRADPRTMTREQRIAERTRDLLDEIVDVPSDPYPASVGEVADEIARYVLELDASGAARGLADKVFEALYRGFVEAGRERAAQDAAQVLATVTTEPGPTDPDVRAAAIKDWEETNRPY